MTQLSASFVDELVNGFKRIPPPLAAASRDRLVDGGVVGVPPQRPPRRLRPLLDAAAAAPVAWLLVAGGAASPPVALSLLVLWPALLAMTGSYARRAVHESWMRRSGRVARSAVALAALCWLLGAVPGVHTDNVAMAPGVLALPAMGLLTASVQLGRARVRLVLVGHPREVRSAMAELERTGRYVVAAVCLTRRTSAPIGDAATFVGVHHAIRAAAGLEADALLVLPGRDVPPASLRRLAWAADEARVQLYVGTPLLDVDPRRTSLATGGGLTLVHVGESVLGGPLRAVKEVAERAVAAVALLSLAPFLAVVALLIRLDSAGPAIFRQERIGRHGEPFTMLKLRSMSGTAEEDRVYLVESNEADGLLFKILQDPRVTPVGRWLRRYSVDELPQLWNVVMGDMSLVGPRPALPGEVAQYDADVRRRLAVKPGLTGLWQVSGRSDLSWQESVRLDLRYVDNWSPRLDLWILGRTVRAVLDHRGAY